MKRIIERITVMWVTLRSLCSHGTIQGLIIFCSRNKRQDQRPLSGCGERKKIYFLTIENTGHTW